MKDNGKGAILNHDRDLIIYLIDSVAHSCCVPGFPHKWASISSGPKAFQETTSSKENELRITPMHRQLASRRNSSVATRRSGFASSPTERCAAPRRAT